MTETDRAAGAGPVLPQLSCDSHMHVFGPPERFRGAPDRTYDPRPRELDEYEALAARLGLERTVFVQPSAYGSDNSCLLEALARRPRTARGVAVIDDSYDRRAIEALHGRGIRGIRLNLMTPRISDGEEARSRLERAARQVEGLDWHLQIYADLEVVRMIAPACRGLAMPVVFDHMAGASLAAGRDAAGFDDLLSLLADGKCWVKLSGADIVTWENSDFSGAEPFARAIIQASSTNVVWGSDWPHLVHHHSGTGDDAPPAGFRPVDEEALLRFLAEWAGSDAVFERILVSNPSRLYDF